MKRRVFLVGVLTAPSAARGLAVPAPPQSWLAGFIEDVEKNGLPWVMADGSKRRIFLNRKGAN